MLNSLREEAFIVSDILTSINMWITLKKPRINDGSNFNLSVQEEYVGRLNDVGSAMGLIMDWVTDCYQNRGNYIQKVVLEAMRDR